MHSKSNDIFPSTMPGEATKCFVLCFYSSLSVSIPKNAGSEEKCFSKNYTYVTSVALVVSIYFMRPVLVSVLT